MTAPSWQFKRLEDCACPLCGPGGRNRLHQRVERWAYYRCETCGLLYLNPRPIEREMAAFYSSTHYYDSPQQRGGYQTYERDRPFYVKTFRKRLNRIARLLRPGARVLDVGSGFGYTLEALLERRYEAWATDLPGAGLERCAQLVGDRAVSLHEAGERFASESFDAITLFDVIEHVYSPAATLKRCHGWLRAGGVLMMTTPDNRSWLARLSGRKWVSYKPPEHIFLFNRNSLLRLAGPYFETVAAVPETQVVALDFLAERLARLAAPFGAVAKAMAALPGTRHASLSVPSGSITYIGLKRAGVPKAESRQ